MKPIKIIYIFHDCFWIKIDDVAVIFDFYKDPYQRQDLPNPMLNMDPQTNLYVFVSHGHKDHFNPEIFEWSKRFPNIRYIISKDVRNRINHIVSQSTPYKGTKVDENKIITLGPGSQYETEHIHVDTFASTDMGNSYAITLDGYNIFHAGDLNAWLWMDESTHEEVEQARMQYENIISDISKKYHEFDICFFPVDSRIGTAYYTGAKLFLEKFRINYFFPMHFELGANISEIAIRHQDAADFKKYASPDCHHYIMSAPYSAYFLIK